VETITIYHNGICSKCRGALEILQEKNIPHEVRFYYAEPFSKDELKSVLQLLQMNAFDLLRKKEQLFLDQFEGKNFTEEEWLDVLLENPTLIERPIVIRGNKAIIARPPEKLFDLL
jgi:arsenate reductase